MTPYPCKCNACGHAFTYWHGSGGVVLKPTPMKPECPKCGSTDCSILKGAWEMLKRLLR